MVAYSFKQRFVQPIRVGLSRVQLSFDCPPKRQTIRAIGKRRHARPQEVVQLYHAQRTQHCFKIGDGRCASARLIQIDLRPNDFGVRIDDGNWLRSRQLDEFAVADGFDDPADMLAFWQANHPDIALFDGALIEWVPL